jgi:hypothetical protein
MVKLDLSQAAHLERIRVAKEKYDKEISLLELDLKRQKDVLKNPIRDLVAEGRDIGIPVRQIHQAGLGFAQVNSMVTFLSDRTEGLAATLDRVTSRVSGSDSPNVGGNSGNLSASTVREPTRLKLVEFKPGYFRVTDRAGDDWEFVVFGLQTNTPALAQGHDAFSISDDGEDMRALFVEKWPTILNLDNDFSAS